VRSEGFANAGDRLRKDPDFFANIVRDGPGRLPEGFVKLAIACLALFPSAVGSAAVIKSPVMHSGGGSPVAHWVSPQVVERHFSDTLVVSFSVTFIAIVARSDGISGAPTA
jgi:hypothetical protein